jgi:lipopolysaccharide transport system permease protein
MFATPVVYPSSQVPAQWRWIIMLNPMAPVIETFRHAFLGTKAPQSLQMALSIAMTLLILFGGIVLFSRIEKNFMDTV